MVQEFAGSNPGLDQLVTGKHCQPSSNWVPFYLFEPRREMAGKGEGWALPFTCCAQI